MATVEAELPNLQAQASGCLYHCESRPVELPASPSSNLSPTPEPCQAYRRLGRRRASRPDKHRVAATYIPDTGQLATTGG